MSVPTPNVSCVTGRHPQPDVTAAAVKASSGGGDGPLKGILGCSNEELVSIDFKGTRTRRSSTCRYTKVWTAIS